MKCATDTVKMDHYEVHGIDVSHYQKNVDWNLIKSQGFEFAIIKATESVDYVDSFFCKNWPAIKDSGLKRGAYHFFRPDVPANEQAILFIEYAELTEGDFPPVLDIETTGSVTPAELLKGIRIWLNIVESHYGIKPIIYTNQKFYNKYLASRFDVYPLWIARYHSQLPELHNNRKWVLWQYGNKGIIKGIEGYVDFNVFYGSRSEMDDLSMPQVAN